MQDKIERKGFNAVERIWRKEQILSYEVKVNHMEGKYGFPFFAENITITASRLDPKNLSKAHWREPNLKEYSSPPSSCKPAPCEANPFRDVPEKP
jgi:hypothetical protein